MLAIEEKLPPTTYTKLEEWEWSEETHLNQQIAIRLDLVWFLVAAKLLYNLKCPSDCQRQNGGIVIFSAPVNDRSIPTF